MLTEPKGEPELEELLTGNLLRIQQLYESYNIKSVFVYSSVMMRRSRLEKSCCLSSHAGLCFGRLVVGATCCALLVI